jgi:L-seryl-tRNA(Ser) seleniumtransferase
MLREPAAKVKLRAQRLADSLDGDLEGAHVVPSEATVGGGSMPGHVIHSWAVELRTADPPEMAARLRSGTPSVFCRVGEKGVVFDVRTVRDDELPRLARAILYALEGDDLAED